MSASSSPPDGSKPANDSREMYREIASLVASLAKAFEIPEADIVTGIERGTVGLSFHEDENGNRFVAATYGERAVRVYQGAVKRGH